ncbi:MAG: hypothetical protein ACYC77_04725 [Coriobacteriia bacterium]
MARVIGNADEFYRLRIVRVDAGDSPDLEWRDDILWRRPPSELVAEDDVYRVEAVLVDDEESAKVIAEFDASEDAQDWLAIAEGDLYEMTKAEFEDAYFNVDIAGEIFVEDLDGSNDG